MTSIYEYIASAVTDGELPEGFSLSEMKETGKEIRWADGARDGVWLYHSVIPEMYDEEYILMSDAVRAAGMGDRDLADALFRMLGKQTRAIFVINELHSYLLENQKTLDPEALYEYGTHLLFESDDTESVKFGLSLLGLIRTGRKEGLRDAVRTIGLSDEFSLFAILVMLGWQDGNHEVWQLAKKIHGWGRIHAVDRIEPDTEEIRKWILTEGVHNDVMPAYSALTCWEKADAGTVLRKGPTREEFTGIRDILDGLIDEGPVLGISGIENRNEIIELFLRTAETFDLTQEDREAVLRISGYIT